MLVVDMGTAFDEALEARWFVDEVGGGFRSRGLAVVHGVVEVKRLW